MIRPSESKRCLRESLLSKVVVDIGKYTSLLYGIANVVGDKPDVKRAVYAGVGYVISSSLGHITQAALTDASVEPLRETLDTIAEKILDEEKPVSRDSDILVP